MFCWFFGWILGWHSRWRTRRLARKHWRSCVVESSDGGCHSVDLTRTVVCFVADATVERGVGIREALDTSAAVGRIVVALVGPTTVRHDIPELPVRISVSKVGASGRALVLTAAIMVTALSKRVRIAVSAFSGLALAVSNTYKVVTELMTEAVVSS